jgi:glycosyltransferase involved in cell wall biosynthesis
VEVSICIAAHDKPDHLLCTLESIFEQSPSASMEVIVSDDRSVNGRIRAVCSRFPVQYMRIGGPSGFRNSSAARNVAYRAARGRIVIAQSDETVHRSENCIDELANTLRPGTFVIAKVFNTDLSGRLVRSGHDNVSAGDETMFTGPSYPKPFFFLGCLYRKDLYAVGGNDEEFVTPGSEDVWFADCLIRGIGLEPIFSDTIIGHHISHPRHMSAEVAEPAHQLYLKKFAAASFGETPWQSSGGPWPFVP